MFARRLGEICLVLAITLVGARQALAVGFSDRQPLVEHELAPGEVVQGSIELASTSNEPIRLSVYLEDWQYIPPWNGDKQFVPAGTLPRSCANWISFFPRDIELKPFGQAKVDYTIRMPQDSSLNGGYYAVMFFQATMGTGPDPRQQGVTVQFSTRLGSLIAVTAKGTVRREARITAPRMSYTAATSSLQVSGSLVNEGNVYLVCQGSYHLMGSGNLVAGRGELPQLYTWPGREASFSTVWSGTLAPGQYNGVLTYDCGKDLVVVEEAALSVP